MAYQFVTSLQRLTDPIFPNESLVSSLLVLIIMMLTTG